MELEREGVACGVERIKNLNTKDKLKVQCVVGRIKRIELERRIGIKVVM